MTADNTSRFSDCSPVTLNAADASSPSYFSLEARGCIGVPESGTLARGDSDSARIRAAHNCDGAKVLGIARSRILRRGRRTRRVRRRFHSWSARPAPGLHWHTAPHRPCRDAKPGAKAQSRSEGGQALVPVHMVVDHSVQTEFSNVPKRAAPEYGS